jgi:DNA-binding transcriptional LysR family regulator
VRDHRPSWELFEAFLAVMREGSLSGAARVLGVAQPTVRRRVAALERELGAALFTRSPSGLAPTDAARRATPLAEAMEATARSLIRAVSGGPDEARGTVRVAASELVGVEILPRLLRPLRLRHPELQIELALSNRLSDLQRRDADIAVRMARPSGAALVARRVGTVQLGFFAAPAYLEGRAPPATLEDLRAHDLIGYDTDPQIVDGLSALGLSLTPRDFVVRTDHDLAYLAAIRSGLGIGVTHAPLAMSPRLIRVLPEHVQPLEVWLVAHRDLRRVRRIRVVLDHLADALRGYVDA